MVGQNWAPIDKQAADQGRLAMVDGAADDESQQAPVFMACRKLIGVKQRGIGLGIHQK
jgi:hypothetical protein